MRTFRRLRTGRARAAFTLIELVGVLAIMAILASVIAPNALTALDRAAASSEAQTLASLGGQVKLVLASAGTAPTAANWTTTLASYADLSPAAIAANPRGVARVYLTDPAANPTPRVLILSSLRGKLALPTAANISTAAAFQQIWQTADGSVPPATSWTGWNAWSAVAGSGNLLVIQRVNLQSVYASSLQSLPATLNNRGAAAASYQLVLANGTAQATVNVAAGATVVLSRHPQDCLNLYSAAGGAGLNYSYVFSTTGKTFDFDGTNWLPQ
jgi:prepilin-type N-terminal cleavage/methylation domain-containing protein